MEAVREVPLVKTPPIVETYRQVSKEIGAKEGNFGAFRPWLVAQEFGRDSQKAFEIFMDPPHDTLFPEVEKFISNLKRNPNLDFAVWTQGEMDADAPVEQGGQGFQDLKILATAIEEKYNPVWAERLKEVGLSLRIGSLDKTSSEFFGSIVKAIQDGSYDQVIFLDDKREKLEKVAENLKYFSKPFTLYHIKRENREEKGEFTHEVTQIKDLTEVVVPTQGRVLVLCDFDGTLSDTKKIKADHERRLAELSNRLSHIPDTRQLQVV